MISLRNLINFLPSNYKEEDTYKVDGKGLLERFLEIFGNYFEDYIVNDTSSILDLIDIAHTPEIYLNYLWEFLGELPFAYGNHVDADKWKTYFNGFDSDERIEELSELWLVPKDSESLLYLSPEMVRKVLRYSVSLFKIRGTERFFKIYFGLFNIDVAFSNYPAFITDYADSIFDDQYLAKFDTGYTFDKYQSCEGCGKITATLELLPAVENKWLFNDNRYVLWNNGGFISIDEEYPTTIPITTWKEIDHTVKAIFERFLPVDVRVNVHYDYEPTNTYLINWEVLNIEPVEDPDDEDLVVFPLGRNVYANVKVDISDSLDIISDIKFRLAYFSGSTLNITDKIHDNGSIVQLPIAGTYKFIPCNSFGDNFLTNLSYYPQETLKITK